jgi:hypothetical protein
MCVLDQFIWVQGSSALQRAMDLAAAEPAAEQAAAAQQQEAELQAGAALQPPVQP